MDASCKIQRSIHDVRLTYKYVSRILGTYQFFGGSRTAIFYVYNSELQTALECKEWRFQKWKYDKRENAKGISYNSFAFSLK